MSYNIFRDQTVVARSEPVQVIPGALLTVYISGTGTVELISNPFDNPAKDVVFQTVTASGVFEVSIDKPIIVDITAVTGSIDVAVSGEVN